MGVSVAPALVVTWLASLPSFTTCQRVIAASARNVILPLVYRPVFVGRVLAMFLISVRFRSRSHAHTEAMASRTNPAPRVTRGFIV